MARRDLIHHIVKRALEKDNWLVTHDPLTIKIEGGKEYEIDLAAETPIIAAEKGGKKIAVEIKSFSGSVLNEFHTALGQFLNYEDALQESTDNNDRTLYIALSHLAYQELIGIGFVAKRIAQYRLRFVLIDLKTETVAAWKN